MNLNAIVITSISNFLSPGVQRLLQWTTKTKQQLIVIGDKKTPEWPTVKNVHFKNILIQNHDFPMLSKKLPFNHYSRKNLGYLYAHKMKARQIFDTDDDNCPSRNVFDHPIDSYRVIEDVHGWINIYRYFGQKNIWPRGIPLSSVNSQLGKISTLSVSDKDFSHINVMCFQSLVDGDPDLDAIGRQLFPSEHTFSDEPPVLLQQNQTCPTNSQATVWNSHLLPLLYLPITASFRMTDIWRGVILQEYMKCRGLFTVFGKFGINQIRNSHNLLQDFIQEVDGHIHTETIRLVSSDHWKTLTSFDLDTTSETLIKIYQELIRLKIIGRDEIECLSAYLEYLQ